MLVGGQIDVFDELTIVIALTDTSILNWVFQNSEYPLAAHFAISVDFTFHLSSREDTDLFLYRVSYRDTNIHVYVTGIDTTEHCGPFSNVDLVYFMWEHYIRFNYEKFALTLSHRGPMAKLEN